MLFLSLPGSFGPGGEVDALIGDPAKAKAKLGWEATVKAPELARLMVDADIALLENDAWIDTVDLASWTK